MRLCVGRVPVVVGLCVKWGLLVEVLGWGGVTRHLVLWSASL